MFGSIMVILTVLDGAYLSYCLDNNLGEECFVECLRSHSLAEIGIINFDVNELLGQSSLTLSQAQDRLRVFCREQVELETCASNCHNGSQRWSKHVPINQNTGLMFMCRDKVLEVENHLLKCEIDQREAFTRTCRSRLETTKSIFDEFKQIYNQIERNEFTMTLRQTQVFFGRLCRSVRRSTKCALDIADQFCTLEARNVLREFYQSGLSDVNIDQMSHVSDECVEMLQVYDN